MVSVGEQVVDDEQLCEEVLSRFESPIHDPVVGINDGFSVAYSPRNLSTLHSIAARIA